MVIKSLIFRQLGILLILACALLAQACGGEAILLAALDSGPSFIQRFDQLSPAEKERLSHGCRASAGSLRKYQLADKSTPEKKHEAKQLLVSEMVTIVQRDFAPVQNANAQAWIDSIVGFIRSFVGLPPAASITDIEARRVIASDADIKISKKQAEAFKRLIEKGP
jgi:hypothetical protein